MSARLTFLLFVYFIGTLVAPSLQAQQERIVWRMDTESDAVSIQIQNVRNGLDTLAVDIVDIRTRKVVDTLTAKDFEKTDLKHVFKTKWTPKSKSGLFALSIKGKAASSSKATELTPETPYGKVDFDGQFQTFPGALDYGKKRFAWNLSKPALIRGLVMMKSGLPIAQVLDWRLAPVGAGSVDWDFVGADGLPYHQHPDIISRMQAVPIPTHWIVWGEIGRKEVKDLPEFAGVDLPRQHLDFSIKALGGGAEKVNGIWKMDFRPGAGLRLELDEATRVSLLGKRFEILLYLQGQFIYEESQGVNPFTYALPANLKGQGLQYLTANVVDYAGNWGTQTIVLDFGEGVAVEKKRQVK